MRRVATCVIAGWALAAPAVPVAIAQEPPPPAVSQPQQPPKPEQPPPAEQPVPSDVRIIGATIFTPEQLERRHGLAAGVRLGETPEVIAADIRRRYRAEGYAFAEVTASLDEARVLTIEIDEGQIDDIQFRGVDQPVAQRLREDFSVQPGDVFNRPQASRALDQALEVAQGAITRPPSQDAFSLVRENGKRILEVHLRTRSNNSGLFFGTQEREDWYSPVDGFNPAVGFQSTIFDRERFNHAYWGGYVSYKVASERPGYSFGLERPFFRDGVLQVGASLQDITASDDHWRLTNLEQSLVAFGFRNNFRDYYRRKGYQLHAAIRPVANQEVIVAWRDEEHLALFNETDFGLFRDDHDFRPNAIAQEGDLRAIVVGYTFDTRGLARETSGERFRRHLLDSLYGAHVENEHGARLEWTSEFAPDGFDHDFDFNRHVINARSWVEMSPGRLLSARVIGGFSDGVLPPQRTFALGGIGSVHGYSFKEAMGEGMVLLNGEFRQRFGRWGLAGLAFIDAGRVYDPLPGFTDGWLNGAGVGLAIGDTRIEFGWRLDDIPSSLQVLFRLGPNF